ncbi:hypothetical protein AS149_12815 [Burkholderia cenocepacia]|nr:hypothetical protein AS149_12815 [Burkholderia cenocepacia]
MRDLEAQAFPHPALPLFNAARRDETWDGAKAIRRRCLRRVEMGRRFGTVVKFKPEMDACFEHASRELKVSKNRKNPLARYKIFVSAAAFAESGENRPPTRSLSRFADWRVHKRANFSVDVKISVTQTTV